MRKTLVYCSVILLAFSCGGKDPEYKGSPAVQISTLKLTHTSAVFKVDFLNSDAAYVLCGSAARTVTAEEVCRSGVRAEDGTVTLTGLQPATSYTAFAASSRGDAYSKVVTLDFTTGIVAGDLYPWEKNRDGAPAFADITLCTGGGRPNGNPWFTVPLLWDEARFAPHVSFEDEGGEKWLFDAFLAITGVDMDGNTYGISSSGLRSANQASWAALASYWLDKGGAFDALDKAIGSVASRIGPPPRKRYVVMTAPDPVMFEYFSDRNSSTTYWGAVDGMQLDFSKIDDQIKAYTWYADLCREKFNALNSKYLEFAGLYILSEELVAKTDGWNYRYKRWDRILPKVAEYLHERNEGLYWIPYRNADGTDLWQDLGIDVAWLQPNYYWDYNEELPISSAFPLMKQWDMGMELEFEYSMVASVMEIPGIMGPDAAGRYVFTSKDVPSLRERFHKYMDGYKNSGLYGKKPVALYSGSNAMYQLGVSGNDEDRAAYLELCRFIAGSPMKKQ